MSDLQVGLVSEGPTDFIVIEAALKAILGSRQFILTSLQPTYDQSGILSGESEQPGWGGVLHWCMDNTAMSDGTNNPSLTHLDMLVIQVDADVASKHYSDVVGRQPVPFTDLPCERPCPPSSDSVNALRTVVSGWAGEGLQAHWIICIPSKSTESWVIPALFFDEPEKLKNLECQRDIERNLQTRKGGRLVRKLAGRYKKKPNRYSNVSPIITERWAIITQYCEQASAFESGVRSILAGDDGF